MKTIKLDLNSESSETSADETPGPSYWRRQFATEVTRKQKIYDWLFGVVLPVICVAADPIVFKNGSVWSHDNAMLSQYRPFAYVLSFVSILAMAAWLLWRERLGWLAAPISGLFLVGSVVSLVVGVIIAPYSLLGLILLIGALGFTPLFSAFIYMRNAFRAYEAIEPFLDTGFAMRSFVIGVVFSFCVPFAVNAHINRVITDILSSDPAQARQEAWKLKIAAPITSFSEIAERYGKASDEEKRSLKMATLAEIYRDTTGAKIDGPYTFLPQ